MHVRRSLLYVPGDDRHKIEKALTFGADCLCLDLEDGVAQNRKEAARFSVAAALRELDFGASEKLTRINPVGSGLEEADLSAVLPARPDGIVLPKVESLEQVAWLEEKVEAAELAHGWPLGSIRLIVDVETSQGIIHLTEIASHPRLDALIFGAEDYAVSIGAVRTLEVWEVFTARSLVVMHAKANGLQAIDMVTVDYRDLERVRREALFGAQMGYTGKQVIHPAQVGPVQEAFTPDDAAIRAARELVEAFETHQREGRGAFGLGLYWHIDQSLPAGVNPIVGLIQHDWRGVDVQTAETMAFVTLSLCELFRAYTVRSEKASLFRIGVFSNKWMQYAVGLSLFLLLTVSAVPFLQPIFNTHFLSGREWLIVIGLALIPAVSEEIYKFFLRLADRRKR